MGRRLHLMRSASWNLYSALISPLVTFFASALIIIVSLLRGRELLYTLPLAILAVSSISAFVFWCFRLTLGLQPHRKYLTLTVGYISYIVGAVGLLVLVSFLLAKLFNSFVILIPRFEFTTILLPISA